MSNWSDREICNEDHQSHVSKLQNGVGCLGCQAQQESRHNITLEREINSAALK